MRLSPGVRVGGFEITAPIGAGGMGEVYLARDTSLGRDVAMKILPESLAADPERLSRFQREARVLASLNHPNIGSIYGFEDADGVHALVLELIDGPTLAERIGGRAMPPAEVLPIARQIAGALDAAHEAGIIHRDLKPANIKVKRDGTVKILDFGLAKALTDSGASPLLSHAPTMTAATAAGVVLGTPAYMSPEQARGFAVDRRTDIWAFGCLLYEMLTGRRPFDGQTMSDTIAAILGTGPDWEALPSTTPHHVRQLLRRCLERDQKLRLRDIGDALPDLVIGEPAESASAAATPAQRAASFVPWVIAAAAVIAAITLAVRDRTPASTATAPAVTLEQLTFDTGLTTMPAVSPDGSMVVYASDRAGRGNLDIWVQRIAGGTPLPLTDDAADDQMPDFAPDGSQIVFRSEREGGGIYLVPALGGPARRIIDGGRDPKFSPDGKRIAYWDGPWRGNGVNTGRGAVFVANLGGGEPQRLVESFINARNPAWSPDGRALMILGRRDDTAESFDWWRIPLDGGAPAQTGIFARAERPLDAASGHAWTASGLVFAGRGSNLWSARLSADGKAASAIIPLTTSTAGAAFPSADRNGAILFGSFQTQRLITRAAISASGVDDPPVPVYADGRTDTGRASVTADGSVIVFEQAFPYHREIWQRNLRSGVQQMIARIDGPELVNATVSPDGARVAYTVNGNGRPGSGFIVETSGGVPRRVCESCALFGFTPDNHRVLAIWERTIGAIDPRDQSRTELVRAATGNLSRAHLSPDGKWMAFRRGPEPGGANYVVRLVPGAVAPQDTWQAVKEPTTTGRAAGWSLDSRVLYLLLDTDGFRCLWGQHVDAGTGRLSGEVFPVRHFHGTLGMSTSFGNPITPQGFFYEEFRRAGNIWRLTTK